MLRGKIRHSACTLLLMIIQAFRITASDSELKVAHRASKRLQIRKTTKNFIIYIYKQNDSRLFSDCRKSKPLARHS